MATAAAYGDTDRRQATRESRTARRRTPPRPAAAHSRALGCTRRPASPGRARDSGRASMTKWPVSVSPPLCTCGSVPNRLSDREHQPARARSRRAPSARAPARRARLGDTPRQGQASESPRALSHDGLSKVASEYQPLDSGKALDARRPRRGTGSASPVQPGGQRFRARPQSMAT